MQANETATIDAKSVCVRSIELMARGSWPDFDEVVGADAVNREAADEPLAARRRGPAAFLASAQWLRSAFDDLTWQVLDVVAEADLVCVHAIMSGRHTRPFVLFAEDGRPRQAFAPTGRQFRTSQTHWFRLVDGKIVEHWANRDDQGQALQLGWVPPSPIYLLRMAIALRRARRDHRDATTTP